MKNYSISQLAKRFGLSRSTLLYYDRIGLLRAGSRTTAGYRCYSEADRDRLERICTLRAAGLTLDDIGKMLAADSGPSVAILEARLHQLGEEILALQNQQHTIVAMLRKMTGDRSVSVVDKAMWVEMLASAGMDEAAMRTWHAAFEARSSEAHRQFLISLGIAEDEVQQIQGWCRDL